MDRKGAEIIVFIFGGFFILFGLLMIIKSKVQLDDLIKYSGPVIDKGIVTKHTTSRYGLDKKVFYLQMSGLNEKLAVYKWNREYSDLMQDIKIGDSLTLYYGMAYNKDKINIDLYQIESNKKVLYGLTDSTPRFKWAGLFVILISIPLFAFGLFLKRLRINGKIDFRPKKKK